jgi:hypothetical protein
MAAMYSPYDHHQKRAGLRQIPVVVLEPIGPRMYQRIIEALVGLLTSILEPSSA